LIVSTGFFPYYEGLNKIDGKNQYWAGFYWRNNQYPIQFLREICMLCQQTNIGKISITPWKTFLIKGIETKNKIFWDELIGRNGINMRHSSFELNWHLPLLDNNALSLKRYLVSRFDKFDIRTFGLSFAIQSNTDDRFTSIVIRSKSRLPFLGKFDFTRKYSIEYAHDYNPNSNYYIEYAGNLDKNELPEILSEISKRYYTQLFARGRTTKIRQIEKPAPKLKKVHQCPDCLTIYDEKFGDQLAGINAGTKFSMLTEDYKCQVCEAPKLVFNEVEITDIAS
jgi:rubredoxin